MREVEVFSINASNSEYGVLNRWVVYGAKDNYEVYLETTKDNRISKAHASTFDNQDEAIEFIVKMDKLCTNGRASVGNIYLSEGLVRV